MRELIRINQPIIGKEEIDAATEVLKSGILTEKSGMGPRVLDFEKEFARYVEAKHAVAVNSGTAALHTALMVAGVKQGDEVVLPSFTFHATAEVVLLCGEGYEHFTLKEIEEQPLAIAQTLGDEQRIDEAASFARIFKKIQVVACGSSYHASLVFKYLVEKLARIPCEVAVGSEYTFGPLHVADGDTLLIGVSQSGETADTLVAMKHAKAKGVKILGLTNTLGSSLTRDSDQVFYTHAGPEISVIATKTFTSQIAALSHLAFELVGRKDLTAELKQSGGMIEKILKMQPELKEISRRLSEKKDFFFIGRGISYPTALEGALKLKEITYKHAEAYPGGELKHGPLSLIEHGVPVIAIAPGDETERKMLGSIKECKARGAQIIAVSDSELILREADVKIRMPAARHELAPLLYVIPLQLMAYYIAVEMKRDPDKPRNLAKSITVE